jgi:hypothetical protein
MKGRQSQSKAVHIQYNMNTEDLRTNMYTTTGIRTHDLNVREGKNIPCLKSHGSYDTDGQLRRHTAGKHDIRMSRTISRTYTPQQHWGHVFESVSASQVVYVGVLKWPACLNGPPNDERQACRM